MAAPDPTHRSNNTPPAVGKRASVRVDAELHADLAVLMSDGTKLSDAVRQAVGLLANSYRRAWDYGDVPDGTAPHVLSVRYALSDGTPEWLPRPSDTSHPQVREVPAAATRAA
ncbi:hypothetical protein [Streptomyces sp. Da 82-17]|uniref:hypothetical protein n=1 Tax=Streptomyces sp. Da 82-17 TaxID=3377116 RepID=UPI0038D393FF